MPFPITEHKTVASKSNADALFELRGKRAFGTATRHLLAAKPTAAAGDGGGGLSAASTAPGYLVGASKKRSRQRSSAPNQERSRPRLESFAWKDVENKENVDPRTGRTSSPFSCSPFASSFAATRPAGNSYSAEPAYHHPLSPSRKKRMLQRENSSSPSPSPPLSSSSSRSTLRDCGRGGKRVGGSGGGAVGARDGISCSSSLREPLRVLWTSEGNGGNARNASAPFCCNALRAMR